MTENEMGRREDYRTERNLTFWQRRYREWWKAAYPYQGSSGVPAVLTWAFQVGARRQSAFPDLAGPGTGHLLVRPVGDVSAFGLWAVPRSRPHDRGPGGLRMHLQQFGFREVAGGVTCSPVDSQPPRHWDLAKPPVQDHVLMVRQARATGSLGAALAEAMGPPEPTVLASPFSGDFRVVRDDLGLRLEVDGVEVYRLPHDAAAFTIAGDGPVARGETLATVSQDADWLASQPWASSPGLESRKPVVVRTRGDRVSGSNRDMMSMAVQMLEEYHRGYAGDISPPQMPVVLAAVPHGVFESRREHGWRPTTAFRTALVAACRPSLKESPELEIRAAVGGPVVLESLGEYKRLSIGGFVQAVLPNSAVIEKTEAAPGDVVGRLAPQAFFADAAQLEEFLDSSLPAVQDAFLASRSPVHGTDRLVPVEFLGGLPDGGKKFLDFRGLPLYGSGAVGSSAMTLARQFQVGGVSYEVRLSRPASEIFTAKRPSAPQGATS